MWHIMQARQPFGILHPMTQRAPSSIRRLDPEGEQQRIRRRNALGLLEVAAITKRWGLNPAQACTVMGTPARTLARWKEQAALGALDVGPDTVERMSLVLGISKSLQILLPSPANQAAWLNAENSGYAFNGKAPITRLLSGRVSDLFVLREALDGARG